MMQKEIETIVLERLYDSYFRERDAVNLNTLCDELELDKTLFWNTIDRMIHQGLIRAYTIGGNYMIQSIEIISAEEQNIGTEEIKRDNQRIPLCL